MPIARAAVRRAVTRLGAVALAGALLAACGSGSSGNSMRRHRRGQGHAHRRPVRHLRLQGGRALQGVREAPPEHHHQGDHHRERGRLLEGPPDPPRRRRRPRRRPGHRGRPDRRRDPAAGGQVRGPQLPRREQPQGGLLRREVVGRHRLRRPHPGPGHRHRPRGDVLPLRPAQAGGPPHRPRNPRQVLVHLGRLPRPRQAVPGQGPGQELLDGQRRQPLLRHERPAEGALLRRLRQAHLRFQPRRQNLLGHLRPGRPGRPERQARRVDPRLEPGLQLRLLRHDRLPRLDARLHQGPGRPPARASGTSRRCPAARATGAGRTCPFPRARHTRRRPSP